jgi:uncharacterized protein YbjT (DUF2867 family)
VILLTGAAGKTGVSILQNLSQRGVAVRALVRNQQQVEKIAGFTNTEAIIGDLLEEASLTMAVEGADTIYIICPNMSTDELQIVKRLIRIAQRKNVSRIVYHSVLHPQVESMPHHWQKMRVEESLFTSGLDFTILQPCAYMQNILSGWKSILEGQYVVPYSLNSRISIVDLENIGKVAAKILTETGHSNAIYELSGPENLSQYEVADQLSEIIKRPVQAVEQSRQNWRNNARESGMQKSQVELLIKMFEYYDKFGLVGNSSILEFLLGSKPTTFKQFITRTISSGDEG